MLSRSILCGGVWNGFLLEKERDEVVKCRFCGGKDVDGELLWDCTFLPVLHSREHPESCSSWQGIAVGGLNVCFGMNGRLVLALLASVFIELLAS